MEKYFVSQGYPDSGFTEDEFLALGRRKGGKSSEPFNMALLALRMSEYSNGVSKLHGAVSRRMWKDAWPGLAEEEIPIESVTNGIHIRSWISYEMSTLFDR
ncbi:alpha-glucan phosphorylase, partial [bacterium]|nr:alpha-glucan phosphorylase [bacterium]